MWLVDRTDPSEMPRQLVLIMCLPLAHEAAKAELAKAHGLYVRNPELRRRLEALGCPAGGFTDAPIPWTVPSEALLAVSVGDGVWFWRAMVR